MRSPWLAAACLLVPLTAQQLPPYELPADVAAAVRVAGRPEPMLLLAELGSMELPRRARAEEIWSLLDARSRCALVRAGLRALDPGVAFGAAAKAGDGAWLDAAECKRAVRAGMGRCNVVDTPFDVAAFFKLFDARDTAEFLANPGEPPYEVPQFFDALHHRFGPEHAAQVEQLGRGDHVLVRRDAARYLPVLRVERAMMAHHLLAMPVGEPELPKGFDYANGRLPFVPRSFTLRPAGDGWPPLLEALLERLLEAGDDELGWRLAWLWARDVAAGPADAALLERLLRSDQEVAQRIGVRGVREHDLPAARELLAAVAGSTDDEALAPLLALVELHRRGDGAALATLRTQAAGAPLALALWWNVAPAEAAAFVTPAFAGDVAMAVHLVAARDDGEFWGEPMAGVEAHVASALAESRDGGPALGELLLGFPGLRTVSLARRAIAALDARNVEQMPLAVLELADAPALAAALQHLLAGEGLSPDGRERIVTALCRLGAPGADEAAVDRLWEGVAALGDSDRRNHRRIELAAALGPRAANRLLAGLDAEQWTWGPDTAGSIAALWAAGGVDTGLAKELAEELARLPHEPIAALREPLLPLLRAGEGRAAVLRYLADRPLERGLPSFLWTLGAEGMALLRRYRDERELGYHCQALGELARGGDQEARAEVESAIRRRFYRWIDTWTSDALTDGQKLERVPLLLSQLDANCCVHAVVESALDDLFEVDTAAGGRGVLTRGQRVVQAFERGRGRFAWSRIAGRWLVAPR